MQAEYILLALGPVFAMAILLEYHKAQAGYTFKELILNASLALSHQATDLLSLTLLMPFFHWLYQHGAIFTFELNGYTILAAFILQDFLYYWFHRASHHCNWLWAAHVVHHSSINMNFSTAMRQSLFYPMVGMWLFWLPLILLGYSPELVMTIVALNLAYQFFVHTEHAPELKWFGKIFNTPTHHCLHHAHNACYVDKNFAGVLIIWDKLFGTFVQPKSSHPPKYGVTDRLYSLSFVDVVFTPWLVLIRNMQNQPRLRDKLNLLISSPKKLG
ncbi:sterol desaturase family protein [Pseudoalteromonas sp. MMG022]|uniref:sterol desaturase family protein n=1 Tax=Pseudoalteromonas sp. MMG022 TaxID=2909978 RepID=UPI001F38EB3B|nr:sterol desaturase family protein [Pseudoalteromonas sp. MMG022]MCF6435904.1 sterol desaturase family protein [Pseudoalteromonas sp. MMG022]